MGLFDDTVMDMEEINSNNSDTGIGVAGYFCCGLFLSLVRHTQILRSSYNLCHTTGSINIAALLDKLYVFTKVLKPHIDKTKCLFIHI